MYSLSDKLYFRTKQSNKILFFSSSFSSKSDNYMLLDYRLMKLFLTLRSSSSALFLIQEQAALSKESSEGGLSMIVDLCRQLQRIGSQGILRLLFAQTFTKGITLLMQLSIFPSSSEVDMGIPLWRECLIQRSMLTTSSKELLAMFDSIYLYLLYSDLSQDLLNRSYTITMECEKSVALQATADIEHLIADSFLIDGHLTDLYLFPNELKLIQENKVRVIPIHFGLSFIVLQNGNEQPTSLEFCVGEEKVTLERDFWPRAKQWQTLLMGHITRRDFHQFFKPVKKIGRGNFATVYLAEDIRNKRPVAIKAFMKEVAYKGDGRIAIENQIKILRKVKNQSIAILYGVYETKNSLYLSTQFAEGSNLQTFLRKNKETTVEQRKKIMRSLLSGLKELSKQRIVHRDIKPENIIVSQNCEKVKIVDFGLATQIDEPHYIFVRCGTPGFVAPEILKIRDVQTARLGVESDMFSLGAIYYHLVYGHPLFPGKNQNEVLSLNRHCRIKVLPKQNLAYGELELLCSMLQHEPQCRVTAEQALKSSFFQQKADTFGRALQPLTNQSMNSWFLQEK